MDVSVVIPTLNEAEQIAAAIERAGDAGATEVIIADGGSSDGTCEIANDLNCIVVHSPRGRGAQLNKGAARTTGDVLVFLHADNWLEANALKQLEAFPVDNLAGCFRQRIEAPEFRYRVLEWGNAFRATWLKMPYGDQGIFIARSLFESIGGFPNIPLMEELPFMRNVAARTKLRLLPGPLHVSARRWQRNGVIGQTLRNWSLLARYYRGVSPEELAKSYPAHNEQK